MPSDKEVSTAQSGDEDTVIAEGMQSLYPYSHLSQLMVATAWLIA